MGLSKDQQTIQLVLSKAWDDPSFKQELIADPILAIKKLTGETISIPEGKILKVFDQSNPDVICFNIPQKPDFDDVELSDNQLEAIAGGYYLLNPTLINGCINLQSKTQN